MKCPLTTAIDYEDELITKFHTADCLKEECAWWDETCEACSIRSLTYLITALGNTLGKLADRKSINVQLAK